MHCPRCGTDALVGQQFCRSCGFNLERVAELLTEQLVATSDTRIDHARLRQRRIEHWASIAGLAMMSLVLLTLIYLIISEMMIKGGEVGVGLLLLLIFVGAAVLAGLQGYAKTLKQQLATRQPVTPEQLVHREPEKQLSPHREPAESVTEHTTELLIAPPGRTNTKEI